MIKEELYVDSSVISRIKYYPELHTLEIEFKETGHIYHYLNFPGVLWFNFRTAESKGSFFNEKIKGYYAESRIR